MVLSDSPFTKLSLLLTFLSLTIAEHDGIKTGPPGFRVVDINTCTGSVTPENRPAARIARLAVLPSPSPNKVGVLNVDFGAQYRACTFPCQRLTDVLTNISP